MQIYPYQQECLDAIESARQAGSKKALVVMATGLGKTVVSALQLKRMLAESPGRVLYVTHQNEILRQARHTYESILPSETSYGYFHGQEKHLHRVDVLFASFQTMALSREQFARDEFKYVIVDEAHHVHAETYRPTVEYFQPDFMIGLTATPDRADQKDIRQLMGEPVFDLGLFEALADRHLTPIDYRLMTDELQNLEVLETPAGKLSIAELNRTIFVPKRDEEIVRIIEEKLEGVTNPRTIIFCSSVAHAEQLGELMPYAQVIHSKVHKDQRMRRIAAFRKGHSRIVITVDMFNEGIDIPEANVIVFLRSTASRTIYLQQLGRGLRRIEGKEEVLVLDFVANCERIEMIDYVQQGVANAIGDSGETTSGEGETEPMPQDIIKLTIDGGEFDERLVDLVSFINRARQNYTKEELTEQLLAFAEELGRTPSMADVRSNKNMADPGTFFFVFGVTWNEILSSIGLSPNRKSYTKEKLTEQLLAFAEELGRAPSIKEVNTKDGMASTQAYYKAFGTQSWPEVLVEVGLTPQHRKNYTKEELTEQLLAFAEELGHTPSIKELRDNRRLADPDTYVAVFGKAWHEILADHGLKSRKNPTYTKEGLTEQLLAFAKELGRTPTGTEVNANPGMTSTVTYQNVFGMAWNDILVEVGLKPTRVMRPSKESLARQLIAFAEKLGQTPTMKDVKASKELPDPRTFLKVFGKKWPDILAELGLV